MHNEKNIQTSIKSGLENVESFPQFQGIARDIHTYSIHTSKEVQHLMHLPSKEPTDFMKREAETYRKLLLPQGTYLLHITLQQYEQLGSEGWMEQDLVFLRNTEGNILHIPIFKKAVTAGAPRCHETALEHARRLEDLQSLDIPVVEVFTVQDATIYTRLYPNNLDGALQTIDRQKGGWGKLLGELIRIGKTLDGNGYHAQGFIGDLLYDGTTFRYADAGTDLGGVFPNYSTNCLQTLLRRFPKQEKRIRDTYEHTPTILRGRPRKKDAV